MKTKKIVIFGTWKEAAQVLFDINARETEWDLIGILDENPDLKGKKWHDIPFVGGWEWAEAHSHENLSAICCIGKTKERKRIIERLLGLGYDFPNIVHPTANISKLALIGRGNLICAGVQIHPDSVVGNYNMLNVGVHIAHDVKIGNYCNINSYATIVDKSIIEDMVYVGASATVIKGVTVGREATIGACALVNKNVNPGTTVIGVPAREMKRVQS